MANEVAPLKDKIVILVTGSRHFKDVPLLRNRFEKYKAYKNVIVIHGAARGLDQIAGEIATQNEWISFSYPARWNKFGRSAGPIRNQVMLAKLVEYRDMKWKTVIETFPHKDSVGTRHMIRIAQAAEFNVNIQEEE